MTADIPRAERWQNNNIKWRRISAAVVSAAKAARTRSALIYTRLALHRRSSRGARPPCSLSPPAIIAPQQQTFSRARECGFYTSRFKHEEKKKNIQLSQQPITPPWSIHIYRERHVRGRKVSCCQKHVCACKIFPLRVKDAYRR